MEPQEIIDLGRGAIKAGLMIGGPILLASLIVGMLVGVLQAMTQVPDQSVSFVPKLICLVLAIGVALPWLTDRMLDYSREALATPISLRHPTSLNQAGNFDRTAAKERVNELSEGLTEANGLIDEPNPRSNNLQLQPSTDSQKSELQPATDPVKRQFQEVQPRRPNQERNQEPNQDPNSKPDQVYPPSKPPFQLPNFRFSRLPAENQSG